MTTAMVKPPREQYLADFKRLQERLSGPTWLRQLRQRGIEHFSAVGFPTARRGNEPWKYTDVAPMADKEFHFGGHASPKILSARTLALFTLSKAWDRLTFVDGRYRPELSKLQESAAKIMNLAVAVTTRAASEHLGRLVAPDQDGFTALNAAFLNDGAFVHLPAGTASERPIHLLFINSGEALSIVHPRILLVAERGSSATVIESYVSLSDGPAFTNTAFEMFIGEGAQIEHYKLLFESTQAFHVANSQVLQARDGIFTSASIAAGDALARNAVTVTLDGEGARCTLNGLYYTKGTQHVDNHLFIDHAKPRTRSDEFFKGIVDGHSRAVFGGRVLVRRDSQKAEAHQYDKNLVLSKSAEIDSKPQLEILADDVKCTHGATAGQLSDNDLFYLQARGIDQAQARDLLAHAFATELLDRISLRPVRKRVEDFLLKNLPSLKA